jgi:glucosamine kinase
MPLSLVIGVDGGGTYTRGLALTLAGETVAKVTAGPGNPEFSACAQATFREVISELLNLAGSDSGQLVSLVAGLAGFRPGSGKQAWLQGSGLRCPSLIVSDAHVAHMGAFATQPGIVALVGTGASVLGLNPAGQIIRNHEFKLLPRTGAAALAYSALTATLHADQNSEDGHWLDEQLAILQLQTASRLEAFLKACTGPGAVRQRMKLAGLAAEVTRGAERGVPAARQACELGARELAEAVALVASRFPNDSVDVVLGGGTLQSAYYKNLLQQALLGRGPFKFVVAKASPVEGAARLALQNPALKRRW